MASRNISNKGMRNPDSISTKKTFKVNRGNGHRPQPAQIEDPMTTSSVAKRSFSKQQNGTQNQSVNQNYSSRNSLRTAQSIANSKKYCKAKGLSFKMPTWTDNENFEEFKLERGIDQTSNYVILNNEYFVRLIDNNIICILCGKREKTQRISAFERHLASQKHTSKYCELRSSLLNQTPGDSSLQMNAICELLTRWYQSQSLTERMIESRQIIIEEFNTLLKIFNPECRCRLIGSLMTGTSLVTSDINLELIHPNSNLFETDPRSKNSIHHKLIDPNADFGKQINHHTLHYDLIPNALDTLYKLTRFQGFTANLFEVVSSLNDLNGKIPKLVLRHIKTHIILEVSCYAESSHKLAVLLNTYLSLDDRARILSVLVKCWAKICTIDNPNQGTFPPDAFVILVIYYLQRVSPPILPCLHEIISKGSKSEEAIKDPGNILIESFNKLEISADSHKLAKEKTNNSINGHIYNVDQDQPENSLDNCIEPGEDEIENEDEEDDGNYIEINNEEIKNLNWSSSNKISVQKLFIDFLKFMIEEFNNVPNVITIRTLRKVSLSSKGWGTQVKAIENPTKPRVNISRCIGTFRTFEFIRNCFKHGYYYLLSLPLDSSLKQKFENRSDPRDFIELYVNQERLDFYFRLKEGSIQTESNYDYVGEMITQNLFAKDVEVINALFDTVVNIDSIPNIVANFYRVNLMVPKDVASTVFCWLCRQTGHSRQSCPKGRIKNLQSEVESYNINIDEWANFDSELFKLYRNDLISPALSKEHTRIVNELTNIINSSTGLNCRLQLFGSTVNNLGSCDSDLDICMTLEGNLTGKGVDCVEILQKVNVVLDQVDDVHSVEAILSARVPIIKFKYGRFDVDLSMYNQCATYNSKLLKTYSMIDKRVAQLFYLVKRYAKACSVADASRGSLSSYAWSLMVIHYLQHTDPPILPVLQEATAGVHKELIGINGWNVWFQSDLRLISKSQNKSGLTKLFKEFFLYYGNSFNFDYFVVSIRKTNHISKFQKNWYNCIMAIEDPFELTYNLSSRLDEPMAIYIINSFAQAYMHIMRIQKKFLDKQNHASKFYLAKTMFNGRDITNSSPPYRGCRSCHRIGHKVKDCPDRQRLKPLTNSPQKIEQVVEAVTGD